MLNHKNISNALVALIVVASRIAVSSTAEAVTLSGSTFGLPTHYQSYSSTSPSQFSTAGGGPFTDTLTVGGGDRFWIGTGEYFYLENAEDGLVDTTGLTSSEPVSGPGAGFDSVDEDDGVVNNINTLGRDVFHGGEAGTTVTTFTFSAGPLGGQLPTYAGLVMTDGDRDAPFPTITIEAFDSLATSVGSFIFTADEYFDGSFGSTDASEDTFFGFNDSGGIAEIVVSIAGGGDRSGEFDHIQYGFLAAAAVPEPSTLALGILGMLSLSMIRRRRRR